MWNSSPHPIFLNGFSLMCDIPLRVQNLLVHEASLVLELQQKVPFAQGLSFITLICLYPNMYLQP